MELSNFSTPILFIVYNRPDTTEKVFEVIKRLKPRYLFVASDGYKENKEEDKKKVLGTRALIDKEVNWNCELQTRYCDYNQGCYNGVKNALNWFFEKVDYGIILEDDILPSLEFFKFQEDMLIRYKDDKNILSVSGFNFGMQVDKPFTSRFMNMWGWGTWKRSANEIDYKLKVWKKANVFQKYRMLVLSLKEGNSVDIPWIEFWYKKFSELAYLGEPGTWDFQWVFFGLINKRRIVVPPRPLTINIGFNHESATHTKRENQYLQGINLDEGFNIDVHSQINYEDNSKYEELLKKQWCFISKRNYQNATTYLFKKTLKYYLQKPFIKK